MSSRLLTLVGCAVAVFALLVGPGSVAAAGCPSSNPPNMLAIVDGSSQTTKLGKAFQSNLQVALANSNGCPLTGSLAGISVDFSAPGSGASGTFASSGSSRVTVGTNAQGVATAPAFIANDSAGSYSIHADTDYGSAQLYLTNTAGGVVASIAAAGPTEQAATVNSRYGQTLQAQVLDANGQPVPGVGVSFTLATGATGAGASFLGGGAQATATTKANGQATSPPFVANGSPGRFTATATTADISTVATFGLANHAAGNTLTATTAQRQTAAVGGRYGRLLEARVLDATGQPIEGASVTFTLPSTASGAGAGFLGGGSQASTLTDGNGRASSPPLVANSTAGRFTATAAVTGIATPVSYALENVAGAAATIATGAADGQATAAGSRFPIRLAVTVTDADKNLVAGVLVTFRAPSRGPGGRFARAARIVRVKTNADGVAVAPPFIANARPGGYVVTAAVAGTKQRAAFALVNRQTAR
jgi:protocatechuate 3,4-dioxygenase beta subunit